MTVDEAQRAAFAEAIRAVIGIVAAHRRDEPQDAAVLLNQFQDSAESLDLSPCAAWAMLFSGSLHWITEFLRVIHTETDIEPDALLQKFASEAALWVSENRGRGGY